MEGNGGNIRLWPEDLLFQLSELAKKSVESGIFDTTEQAIESLKQYSCICTEEDYNTESGTFILILCQSI
jgi:hypothetical protein